MKGIDIPAIRRLVHAIPADVNITVAGGVTTGDHILPLFMLKINPLLPTLLCPSVFSTLLPFLSSSFPSYSLFFPYPYPSLSTCSLKQSNCLSCVLLISIASTINRVVNLLRRG